MKIFITGATGYVGSAVALKLSSNNHDIIALARSESSAAKLEKLGYKVVRGDLTDPSHWIKQASQADAYIHCAQLRFGKRVPLSWVKKAADADKTGFMGLVKAAKLNRNSKIIIYTSGISAVGHYGDRWTDENTIAKESRTVGSYHLETERLIPNLLKEGLPIVVLRLSLPVSTSGTFATYFLNQAAKGKLRYVGDGQNYWPTIHMDDLTNAFVKVIDNPPIGETLIISDDNPLRMREFSELLMKQFGHQKVKSAPKWIVFLFAGKALGKLLVSSYRVRNHKAKKLLDWKPAFPTFRESLIQVIKEYNRQID